MGAGASKNSAKGDSSKGKASNNNNNGDVAEGSGPPPMDSRLPYSAFRDFYTLKNFWKTVQRAEKDARKNMFSKYLKANPENMARYPKLAKLQLENISPSCDDKGFETMAEMYLKVFDDVISMVEETPADASSAIARLQAVGKKHRPFGMKYDDFQKLEEPFLQMVGELLGDRYTDKAETLFRKFFQFCLRYIVEGFQP
uniref:GLOBIN domain-containing protein n=1 Tax=Panagrellus redivivus TaxID=6233 RepID=A0A7E4W3H9_PANRE